MTCTRTWKDKHVALVTTGTVGQVRTFTLTAEWLFSLDKWHQTVKNNLMIDLVRWTDKVNPNPITFKLLWKIAPLNPLPALSALFLLPSTLTPPSHHSPSLAAPGFCSTNQEQMSAGAVLKDPAVLDASHMLFIQRWRLTARLLVKPNKKRESERVWGVEKTNSPNAFKSLQKDYICEPTFLFK